MKLKNYIAKLVFIIDIKWKDYVIFQLVSIFLTFTSTASALLFPYMLSIIVDTDYQGNYIRYIPMYVLELLLIGIIMFITDYIKEVYIVNFANKMIKCIKEKVYAKVTITNGLFWDENKIGDIFTILQQDISSLESLLTSLIGNIFSNSLVFIGVAVYILYQDIMSGILLIFLSVFFVCFQRYIAKQVQNNSKQLREAVGHQSAFLNESLNNMNILHLCDCKNLIINKYSIQNDQIISLTTKRTKMISISQALGGSYNVLGIICVIALGMVKVNAGSMSIGVLFSLLLYIQRLYSPIVNLANQYVTIKKNLPIIDKIYDVLCNHNVISSGNYCSNKNLQGTIEMKHINFSYLHSKKTVFKDLNLFIKKGEIIGIVGDNGSGKSSLIKLLTKIYENYEGKIEIDGVDLKDYNTDYLRKQIGMMGQINHLLSGSIKSICNPQNDEILDIKLKNYMKLFGLNADHFREGIETVIDENNLNLSGGELQRINLIRLLIEDKPINIFDEPTAAIDFRSEKIICLNLREMLHEKTAIIITHRPMLLNICDKIFCIKDFQAIDETTTWKTKR